MKTARDFLKSEVERNVSAAREITRAAEDANRPLNAQERQKVEDYVAEATSLKARIKELEENEALNDRLRELNDVPGNEASDESKNRKARTIGDRFIQSEAYQALKARGLSGRWTTGAIDLGGFKTVGDDIVDEASADDQLLGAPQVVPGIIERITGIEPYKLTVADLFGSGVATTNSIVFLIESLIDDDAYVVAEKAAKPSSYVEFDKATTPIDKLATFLAVSDEMLEDAPQVASYLNSRLALFVKRAEEAFLLTKLDDNVSASAVAADIGGSNGFDAIYAGMVDVRRNGGLEPDAVLIHPTDDAKLTVLKSVAGDGGYFSGGPYAPTNLGPWGLRKVITAAVTAGTAIVGAFAQGATVWRRGGLTVEASNSHSDFFVKNLTAIRAEERLALTVYRPAAFSYVTIP